jgi:hypothetical protein
MARNCRSVSGKVSVRCARYNRGRAVGGFSFASQTGVLIVENITAATAISLQQYGFPLLMRGVGRSVVGNRGLAVSLLYIRRLPLLDVGVVGFNGLKGKAASEVKLELTQHGGGARHNCAPI